MTGGYSRTFGHYAGANFGNFGVGMNYWFASKTGFLVEFRDHLRRDFDFETTSHLWGVRFGVAFRSSE